MPDQPLDHLRHLLGYRRSELAHLPRSLIAALWKQVRTPWRSNKGANWTPNWTTQKCATKHFGLGLSVAPPGRDPQAEPKEKARCSSHRALPRLGSNQDSPDPEGLL
jgi:hypothetical protein